MNDAHSFTGKKIEPPLISKNMTISQLVDFFGSTGYNARRLFEAANIMKQMIDSGSSICLTLAGAMTPIGMGNTIKTLIENGFIDWIVTTGANVYHDLHFAYDLPVRQGHFQVDDDVLFSKQIVRIYDVYIKEIGTLQAQDIIVQREIKKIGKSHSVSYSTADMSHSLGEATYENSKNPEKSFLAAAYKNDVPVFIPAISDSSIGLNMLPLLFEDVTRFPNVVMDIAESTAILWKSKVSGGIELGGGVPKNFFQQTGPALYQILKLKDGGHDYVIQITDARPDTGGLSGATIQEGKSWGKIKTSHRNNVIVYGDSSICFPIIGAYVLSECKKRPTKRLYSKKNAWVEEMKKEYLKHT